MDTLDISLFGGMRVVHHNSAAEIRLTRAVQALLAYLLLFRQRRHSREVLTELFWPDCDEEQARGCLSTALWRLRRGLEPAGTPRGAYVITTAAGEIRFNSESAYWLDIAAFEEPIVRLLTRPPAALDPAECEKMASALALYTGDLLEGFYEDWALRERERLRELYLSGLTYLLHAYHAHGAFDKSVACAQRMLQHDPLRENVHRELIQVYLAMGERAQALRQYAQCREILRTELDVEPMAETQALYA
jgi:DNA-binding SARP family transcriptional activator